MYIDDRLITVLRQGVTGERAARTQYRQILDILGNGQPVENEHLLAEAWAQLGALETIIDRESRAVILQDAGWRLRSPALASYFASDSPDVASAALGRAQLSPDEWQALIPELPVRTRGYLRLRDDLPAAAEAVLAQLGVQDRGLPQPDKHVSDISTEPTPTNDNSVADEEPDADDLGDSFGEVQSELTNRNAPVVDFTASASVAESDLIQPNDVPIGETAQNGSISDLVRRIDAYQRTRNGASKQRDSAANYSRTSQPVDHFAFETDAAGRIDWADQSVASSVIGAKLPHLEMGDGAPKTTMLQSSFNQRLPIRDATVTLGGAAAIVGKWSLSASPKFSRHTGSFQGYCGKFVRLNVVTPDNTQIKADRSDQIREMLHELRTPINAIQGFSELIQQQLFGPTPNAYRALSATIAGDSATMLAACEELERYARLESGDIKLTGGACDISNVLQRMVGRLRGSIEAKAAQINLHSAPDEIYVSMTQSDAEMLCWRLLASIVTATTADDAITVELEQIEGRPFVLLALTLPKSFQNADEMCGDVPEPDNSAIKPGVLGTEFALKLARAEARSVGGDMLCEDGQLFLILPDARSRQSRQQSRATYD